MTMNRKQFGRLALAAGLALGFAGTAAAQRGRRQGCGLGCLGVVQKATGPSVFLRHVMALSLAAGRLRFSKIRGSSA